MGRAIVTGTPFSPSGEGSAPIAGHSSRSGQDLVANRKERQGDAVRLRRLLFIFLLAILSVQFAWAAATGYCRHETGEARKHFGHHEHEHRTAQDGVSKDIKASSSLGADNDCGMCQLSAAQIVPSTQTDLAITSTEPPRFAYGARYVSYIPSGPERPDRVAPTPAVRFGGAVVTGALLLA